MSTASELRKPIYWIVAAKAIDYEQMLLLMAGVKWDIREIMSQHNVYVDVLLKVTLRRNTLVIIRLNINCIFSISGENCKHSSEILSSSHLLSTNVLTRVVISVQCCIKTQREASLLTFRRDNMKTSPHLDCCFIYGTKTLLS